MKSPFFSDLENDLLQGEVTADNVETAFQSYLEKLSGVARLEIKGQWYDDPSRTLHVVGRTYGGDPKTYYYRRLIEGRGWTPWIKVDLDISSDFIIPVVYNNHVYLFWAIIKQQPDVATNWQIQLAYSEFSNGKWTAKKVSENNDNGRIICAKTTYPDMTRFFFSTLDMPIFDYSTVHPITNPSSDMPYVQSILKAITQNGSMVINCCYYSTSAANTYVDSFQLDIAKGYPVRLSLPNPVNIELVGSSGTVQSSNVINMLETEATPPPPTLVASSNSVIPDQSRGRFTKLISFQMSLSDRSVFINQLATQNTIFTGELLPYFYQDQHRTYFVRPEYTDNSTYELAYEDYLAYEERTVLGNNVVSASDLTIKNRLTGPRRSRYINFYHQFIGYFMQRVFISGIDGLMDRNTQLKGDITYDTSTGQFNFATYYKSFLFGANNVSLNQIYTGASNLGLPTEDVDFDLQSGYGLYNWELFYHAPLMIAERLSLNQQFDDADRWYRYIFNPMDSSNNPVPNKFWVTKPFFETTSTDYLAQRIDQILQNINNSTNTVLQNSLIQGVTDWRNNPFQPHFIAQTRTVAYQKVAVMKYIGHLIRYGDYLFGQDTMESVNQATQLYILAAEILGPKPQVIPSPVVKPVENYSQLEQKLDAMSDAIVNVENLVPLQTIANYTGTIPGAGLPTLQTQYFCLPMNENLAGPTGYWDVVADRLFKIRHCLNIDGTLAPLALFAPVINPALLVRATAAGLDLGDILNDLNAPLPVYRFTSIAQKATELCVELKSLGGLLLSVLEKKDAEALSLLRASQETKLLTAVSLLKKKQIDDAQASIDLLTKQKESATLRQQYYSNLISSGLSLGEASSLELNATSLDYDVAIALTYLASSAANGEPDLLLGAIEGPMGGGVTIAKDGGTNVGNALADMARNLGSIAAGLDKAAALTSVNAGYQRRTQEWQFQLDLANKDLEQFDKQIANAQLRLEIAQQDADNQQLQIDQSNETSDFLTSKFTNEDLYNFMITQVSNTCGIL